MDCELTTNNSIKNNRGFSIVELVVCLAILGVATVVIMKSFNLGSWNNSKSQKLQEATSIAESTMEEIKRLSINGLEDKYGYFSDASFYGMDVTSIGASINSLSSGVVRVASKNSVDKYPFYVLCKKNVSIADSGISANVTGAREYNVVATISAEPYKSLSANDGSNANGYQLPTIGEVDQSEHVVLATELNQYDLSALGDIESQYSSVTLSSASITKSISITLEDNTLLDKVSANSTTGLITASCDIEYSDGTKSVRYNVYSGAFSNVKGGNLYIFYKHSGFGMDKINIDDSTAIRKNADGEVVTHNIYFVDQNAAALGVKLNTSYKINISNAGTGMNVPTDCMSDFIVSASSGSDVRKNRLYTNLAEDGGNVVLSGNDYGELFDRNANKNNIYQIDLIVMDADKNEVCASLTSTKSGDRN